MAILTVAELQESREANKAGVQSESEAHITKAIEDAELHLHAILGYKVADDATSTTFNVSQRSSEVTVPRKRVRSVSALSSDGASVATTDLVVGDFMLAGTYPLSGSVVVTGTFGFAEADDEYKLAKNWVLKAAVDELAQTKSGSGRGSIPLNAESVTAEGVSLRLGPNRRPDIADILKLLPIHPYNRADGLYTVSLSSGFRSLGPERVWLGMETVEDL